MSQTTYAEREVRAACQLIYGQVISDRTWCRWRTIAWIPKRTTELEHEYALRLMTLAFLKHESPCGKFTMRDIKKQLQQHSGIEPFSAALDRAWEHIKINGVPGRELPTILHLLTKRKVSERTLRRWCERSRREFSRAKLYYAHEIEWFRDRLQDLTA